MNNKQYLDLMTAMNYGYDYSRKLIISWENGCKMRCVSLTGEYETDTEPEDDDYIGEYAAGVNEIEILQQGSDRSVDKHIYDNSMEISLINLPAKVELEDGTVLWHRDS